MFTDCRFRTTNYFFLQYSARDLGHNWTPYSVLGSLLCLKQNWTNYSLFHSRRTFSNDVFDPWVSAPTSSRLDVRRLCWVVRIIWNNFLYDCSRFYRLWILFIFGRRWEMYDQKRKKDSFYGLLFSVMRLQSLQEADSFQYTEFCFVRQKTFFRREVTTTFWMSQYSLARNIIEQSYLIQPFLIQLLYNIIINFF